MGAAAAAGRSASAKPKCTGQGAKAAAGGGGTKGGKACATGTKLGTPGGGSKWASLRPLLASVAAPASDVTGQLDAQFLKQRILTEVFGLPLRRADEITDHEVIALIRDRCDLPIPAPAPVETPVGTLAIRGASAPPSPSV